ncbi:hypothetical protein AB0280_00765 [Pseudarthrobacter sp902506025]|uniref:hypothetical protein n=1 Tax=Pseudarthrobacter sp. 902506025 TaxID=3155291 RepID=UPI003450274D
MRIEGSFGILQYPVLAVSAVAGDLHGPIHGGPYPWLEEDLLARGFRSVLSGNLEDIVLKARPGDGSIRCRASTDDGLVCLLVDNRTVWSVQLDTGDPENLQWLKSSASRDVTIATGVLTRPGLDGTLTGLGPNTDPGDHWKPLVAARVPTTVGP